MRVRYLHVKDAARLGVPGNFPSFSITGSIIGMKKMFYGTDALLIRSGYYIYNVSSRPDIYYAQAK